MKKITRIDPIQAGKVSGLLYLIIGLIIAVSLFLFATVMGSFNQAPSGLMGSSFFILLAPIFYGVVGFLGGILMAAAYNLIAQWTGGFHLKIETVDSYPEQNYPTNPEADPKNQG